jgi:hypothetical protein
VWHGSRWVTVAVAAGVVGGGRHTDALRWEVVCVSELLPKLAPARKSHERHQFMQWMLLPEVIRRHHNLPLTEKEWGEKNDVDPRQLRRWKADPAFGLVLESMRDDLAAQTTLAAAVPRPTSGVAGQEVRSGPPKLRRETPEEELFRVAQQRGVEQGTDTWDYLQVKVALKHEAMRNPQAAAQWLKTFGEPHIEAERAEVAVLFPDMDDDGLVAATLGLIGVERVSSWLAGVAV